MVYGTYYYSIHWVYKPTNITIVICTITGWWFGTWMDYDLPFSWECHVIPTDELIFFRGVGIPPTSLGFGIFMQQYWLPFKKVRWFCHVETTEFRNWNGNTASQTTLKTTHGPQKNRELEHDSPVGRRCWGWHHHSHRIQGQTSSVVYSLAQLSARWVSWCLEFRSFSGFYTLSRLCVDH